MLDKRKFITLIILGAAILVALLVVIFTSLSSRNDSQPSTDPSAPASTASATASPTEAEVLALTQEEKNFLQSAGATAARYDTNEQLALKPVDYVKAGFTETLSKSYQPIWYGLFAGRTDQQGARINAQALSLYLPESLKVLDYSGSKPGSYVIRVAVKVQWSPISVHLAPGKTLDWRSLTMGTDVGSATWILTYDQLSQRVLKVEQPAWQDLGAEPLFEAMGLPVPSKVTTGESK